AQVEEDLAELGARGLDPLVDVVVQDVEVRAVEVERLPATEHAALLALRLTKDRHVSPSIDVLDSPEMSRPRPPSSTGGSPDGHAECESAAHSVNQRSVVLNPSRLKIPQTSPNRTPDDP